VGACVRTAECFPCTMLDAWVGPATVSKSSYVDMPLVSNLVHQKVLGPKGLSETVPTAGVNGKI